MQICPKCKKVYKQGDLVVLSVEGKSCCNVCLKLVTLIKLEGETK